MKEFLVQHGFLAPEGQVTDQGSELLAFLLKFVNWPLKPCVFAAGVNKFVSVPVELAVLDDQRRVLMFYRKDDEYNGYHMPGTVLRDNEDVPGAIQRLLKSEVVGGKVTPPISLGWVEIPKGSGPGQNPTRHEISLLHTCWLKESYIGQGGEFFAVDQLPDNTLPHHRVLVNEIAKRLGWRS